LKVDHRTHSKAPINVIALTKPRDARLITTKGGLTYLLLDKTADARLTIGPAGSLKSETTTPAQA
jgi:hypothetical protein